MSLKDLIPFRHRYHGVPARTRRRAYDPFLQLHDEMNRLFEDFLPDVFDRDEDDWEFSPQISMKDKKNEIELKVEVPGVKEDDLDVRLDDNVLTITGEKREEEKKEDGDQQYSECRYGSFRRRIPLHAEIDAENVEARFKNGVLTLKLPKQAEPKPEGRKIAVKAS